MELLSNSYPTKENTLKGMLVKGVKVRFFNDQRLCFAEMLTKVDPYFQSFNAILSINRLYLHLV